MSGKRHGKGCTCINCHFDGEHEKNLARAIVDSVRRGEALVVDDDRMAKLEAIRAHHGMVSLSACVGAIIAAEADRIGRRERTTP